MTSNIFVVVSVVLAIASFTSAASKEEVEEIIGSINDQTNKLIAIFNEINTQHEAAISRNSTEIEQNLQAQITITLKVATSIEIELLENKYELPDLQPVKDKINNLPKAYASKFVQNLETAIIDKALEIQKNLGSFILKVSNLKNEMESCKSDDANCFTKVFDKAEEELEYANKIVHSTENYSSEIESYIITEKNDQLKLGEKELTSFSLEMRTLLFEVPVTETIGPLRKNISEVKSETDKLINRYTINLLFNYSRPIDEALHGISSNINQYKSLLKSKNNTLHEEHQSKSSEIQKCLADFNKFDEFLVDNVTILRWELILCASTFNKKINLNSAKSKQLTNKIQRYLDKITVLDLKSFGDLEKTKSDCVDNLHKFKDEFKVYNNFKGDLEEYKENFISVLEENNVNQEAEVIFTKASNCLGHISIGITLRPLTLLIMALITIIVKFVT